MAEKLMDAVAFLSLDNSKFKRSAKESETRMHNLGSTMKRVGGMIAGAVSVGAIVNGINNWTKLGDSIEEASQRTGIAVGTLSRLSYVANLAGSSLEGVELAVRNMQKNIINAPTDKLTNSLGILHLSLARLRASTPENAFLTIMDALSRVSDENMRATLALNIFGKSGAAVLPLIADGYKGLQEQMKKAEEVGAVFTPEKAAAAAKFQDGVENIGMAFQGMLGTIATATPILDGISNAFDMISYSMKSISDWWSGKRGADASFSDIWKELISPGSSGPGVVADQAETFRRRARNAEREAQLSAQTEERVATDRWIKSIPLSPTSGSASRITPSVGPTKAAASAAYLQKRQAGMDARAAKREQARVANAIDAMPLDPLNNDAAAGMRVATGGVSPYAPTIIVANANFSAGPDMKRAVNRDKAARAGVQ